MKISNILLWGASLVVGLTISSCSSEEPVVTETPVFPEVQEYELAVDEVREITFDANMDWRLSTDRQWFKFIDEVGQVQSVSGKAGAQTVQITVTDGALGFVGDAAVVELTMGEQTQTIARISRTANQRKITMYTDVQDGAVRDVVEVSEFDLKYSSTNSNTRIGFEANFDWKFISAPDWVYSGTKNRIEDLNGDAGQKTSINRLALFEVDRAARYEDKSDYIVVGDQNSDWTCQFPVRAAGIPEQTITWFNSRYELIDGFYWNHLGQHVKKDIAGSTFEPVEEPVVTSLLVRNHAYTCKLVTYDLNNGRCKEVAVADTWLESLSDDGKGNITFAAKPNTGEVSRTLYLFVLPEGVEGNLALYRSYFSTGEFVFKDNGFAVQLEQLPMPGGFKVLNMRTYLSLAGVQAAADAAAIAEALKLTATDNIYEKTFSTAEWNDKGTLAFIPKGIAGTDQYTYRLYNSAYEVIDGKAWAGAYTFYVTDMVLGRVWSVNIGSRVPYADIADERMIMVFLDADGKDVGAFVIKKG